MTTAVLMSGQARSFGGTEIHEGSKRARQPWAKRTFENQCWYLYRQLVDPEFFVSLADDEHAREVEPLLLSRFPRHKVHVEIVTQPTLPEPDFGKCAHSSYCISSPPQSILRDLWHRKRAWQFYHNIGTAFHDHFIRVRPDTYFQSARMPRILVGADGVHTPYWSSFGGVNDRFAFISGPEIARNYFNAFDDINSLINVHLCPFHPETLLGGALWLRDVLVEQDLPVHFFTLRRNGDIAGMTLEESVIAYADRMMGV